jgi:hypothetical protein
MVPSGRTAEQAIFKIRPTSSAVGVYVFSLIKAQHNTMRDMKISLLKFGKEIEQDG